MRVLYLATGVFDKGGIARYSRYQIQALRSLHGESNVRALSIWGPNAQGFEAPFDMQFQGPDDGRVGKFAFVRAAAREVTRQRPQPDLIWCNHVRLMPLGLALRTVAPRARVVVNTYGLEVWSDRQWLYGALLRRADAVVAISRFTAEYVSRRFSLRPDRISVVSNCIDTNRFCPRARRVDLLQTFAVPTGPRCRYVLTLGRMSAEDRYKGYDRLLDATAAVQDDRFITLFVGDGEDRPRLERRSRAAGLGRRVFFLGSVPEDSLVDAYNLCDVFALVSDWGRRRGEGFGFTVIEAAACGRAVIVGDEDGACESVVDSQTGRVVRTSDPAAFQAALLEILTNDELRQRMGEAARRRMISEFDFEPFCERTARICDSVVGTGARSH